jgi:ADP-ribose pyrophosphatase YjhB (NUDIX family)
MPQPQVEVASLIMNEGKVLIGRPKNGRWEIPGGEIQPFEEMKEAAIRSVFSLSGVTSDPENVLFVSEILNAKLNAHRVIIYIYSMFVEGDLKPSVNWEEAQWYDVRQLGELQNQMDDQTIDAFFKFSKILRQAAGRSKFNETN